MNLKRILYAATIAACATATARAEIIINEVMQSNVYSMMDDLNDFPDSWIELYNSGDDMVSIAGYRVSTKNIFSSAYPLPPTAIGAGQHLLLYCDKVGNGMHTDFRVDSGKGDIYLFDSEGNVIDHINLKKQPSPEVAYGRESDGAETWGYELTPTPGKANEGGLSSTVLGNVKFSVAGGVWAQHSPIELTLSLPDNAPADAKIIYSVDGSEPTPDRSLTYEAPISIESSVVVRAKAVAQGYVSRTSDANSYIILGREMTLPLISIAINDEYLYDDNIGILVRGLIGDLNENWRQNWRRPINIEYFEGEDTPAIINQLCETRVHGGLSRTNKLKSLAVYANKRFGTKNFGYELWHEDKPGINASKSFLLRNGGNDFDGCYMRDGVIQRVIGRNTDVDWQGYSPVVVYLNGKYHAMMALRERSNEDYVAANYGGLEDIDMFENWEEHKEGNPEAINEFSDFVYGDYDLAEWSKYINVESYANLMAINYWVFNGDFPMNNVVMWRRTDGIDGRWQWIVKDCDYGLGLWNQNDYVYRDYDKFLYTNVGPYVGFDIYQRLMKTDFRDYFINRLVVYNGDFLNARTINEYIDEVWDKASSEMSISHSTWGSNWSDLQYNVNFMRAWADERQAYMPTLMQNCWGLGSPVKVTVNATLSDKASKEAGIRYNDIPLTRGKFDGHDYQGRTLTLSGAEGSVKGWDITIGETHSTVQGPVMSLTLDGTDDINITAILDNSGIHDVATDAKPIQVVNGTVYADGMICAYDLTGRKVAVGTGHISLPCKGIYIIEVDGDTTKVIW